MIPPKLYPPDRGVHHVPYLDEAGDRLLVAITSGGRKLREMPFKPDSYEWANRTLWRQLNDADPLPARKTG